MKFIEPVYIKILSLFVDKMGMKIIGIRNNDKFETKRIMSGSCLKVSRVSSDTTG